MKKRIIAAAMAAAMVCTMGIGLVGCGSGTPAASENSSAASAWSALDKADGSYTVEVTLAGGSGKASVESPAKIVAKDGAATATLVWSSPNYDYMIVDGVKYTPQIKDNHSVFEVPVTAFDEDMPVKADTVIKGSVAVNFSASVDNYDAPNAPRGGVDHDNAVSPELDLSALDHDNYVASAAGSGVTVSLPDAADLIDRGESDPQLLEPFAGEKAPATVNINHAIALLQDRQFAAADECLSYVPKTEESELLHAMSGVLNGRYDENYKTVAATGKRNELLMMLAMKRNKEALKLSRELPDDEALTHYLRAVCLNRTDDAVGAYEELKRSFEMDPSLEKIAHTDGDVNDLLLEQKK